MVGVGGCTISKKCLTKLNTMEQRTVQGPDLGTYFLVISLGL